MNFTVFCQEAAPAPGGMSQGMGSLLMIVAIIAIFYFMMIRPQQKKQKKLREERAAMTKGTKVVTAGGIHGRIVDINETTFVISVADGVKITVEKTSVYPIGEQPVQQ